MTLDDKVNESFLSKVVKFPGRVWSKCKSAAYSALQILPNHPGVFVVDHSDPWTKSHRDSWLRKTAITAGAVATIAALAIGTYAYRREIRAELDPAYSVRLNTAESLPCYFSSRDERADEFFWYAVDHTKFDVRYARTVANWLAKSKLDDPLRVLDYVVSLNCPAKDVDGLIYRISLSGVSNSAGVVRVIDSSGVARADEFFGHIFSSNCNGDLLVKKYLGER